MTLNKMGENRDSRSAERKIDKNKIDYLKTKLEFVETDFSINHTAIWTGITVTVGFIIFGIEAYWERISLNTTFTPPPAELVLSVVLLGVLVYINHKYETKRKEQSNYWRRKILYEYNRAGIADLYHWDAETLPLYKRLFKFFRKNR